MQVKVSFVLDTCDDNDAWTRNDQETFEWTLKESLEHWGDISELQIDG